MASPSCHDATPQVTRRICNPGVASCHGEAYDFTTCEPVALRDGAHTDGAQSNRRGAIAATGGGCVAKRPWHAGDYQRRAAVVVELANLTPLTTCWRCGLRLDQHTPHRNGRPPTWTAGHVVDGQVGGHLAPEASTCNYSAGATHGNRMRVQAVARQW